jgi:predicted FMN-binding regulatory protein PaiB
MTYSPRKQEGRKIPLVDYRMLDIEGKINQISENHIVIQKIKLS